MSRKRNHRMRRIEVDPFHTLEVIRDHQEAPEKGVMRVMNLLRAAYQRLRDGAGSRDDLHLVGVMLNVGLVRGADIGAPVAKAFEQAGTALQECEQLRERHGSYGFTGPGILLMNAAMDLYAELLAMSTPRQMDEAKERALAALVAEALEFKKREAAAGKEKAPKP